MGIPTNNHSQIISIENLIAALAILGIKADSSAGDESQINVNQIAHGFSVTNSVYNNGSIFVLARADIASTANVMGMVTSVVDVNNFVLTFAGFKSIFSSLTPGQTYFLSETNDGEFTVTQPSAPNVVMPLFNAITTTGGYIFTSTGFQAAT